MKYKFYEHKDCEYFPCHKVEGRFNCLFCFCPLYMLGKECGGNFVYTKDGIKDCSECTLVHREDSYDYIISRLEEMVNE